MVKLMLGLAKGKKPGDKRETSAKRDWSIQQARILKHGVPEQGQVPSVEGERTTVVQT